LIIPLDTGDAPGGLLRRLRTHTCAVWKVWRDWAADCKWSAQGLRARRLVQ
jgi:hypothetical protein